jgi:hypothetical protein
VEREARLAALVTAQEVVQIPGSMTGLEAVLVAAPGKAEN